jgi:hypothetical protein
MKQPRDVTGGESVWGGMIPGLGLMNYVLGLLTVPIEVFIRRDFGERYFTRMNFIGGLFVLIGWLLVAKLFGMIGMFNPLAWLMNRGGAADTSSGMGSVIKWYVIFSIAHFLTIWWRDITGNPLHSFFSGRSWFRFIGKGVMFLANLILNTVVRLIFVFRSDKDRVSSLLPVLRDADTFTERFIEPTFVFFWAFFCFSIGQYTMAWWLIFSVMALNLYTGIRHQQERSLFLDYRDQMIDAQFYRMFLAGEKHKGKNAQERMVQETAREVEKNPDVLPIIESQNPSLAKAIERISPKLKAIADEGDEPSTAQPQAA